MARRPSEPLTREQGLQYALRLLKQRMYSSARLLDKLQQRGVGEQDSAAIIARLIDLKLLDDQAYAEAFVRSEARYRRTSKFHLTQKLRQRGIARDLAEQVMDQQGAEIPDELERARHHAQAFWRKSRETDPFAKQQKLKAFLFRKGFPPSLVADVAREFKASSDADN